MRRYYHPRFLFKPYTKEAVRCKLLADRSIRFLLSALLLFMSCPSYSQWNEFKVYSNGLIYDESTMQKLGSIVDSLNLKFRSCDLAHPYYANPQGIAHVVDIPSKTILTAIQDGISFETFEAKYPGQIKQREVWIVKTSYENYDGKKYIRYGGLPGGRGQRFIELKDKKSNDKDSGWVVDEKGVTAFYIEKLERSELPFDYARLVQYVDCMIDTTAEIYFPEAKGAVYQQVDETSDAYRFVSWANTFPRKPEHPDYEKVEKDDWDSVYNAYDNSYARWDSLRLLELDRKMKTSAYWRDLLTDAADEALVTGNSDAQFEFYVGRYLSKEMALKLMRSRRVIGNCSMDDSPRYHAMTICKFAAETTKWDIFLRSHLDIMNDRFERQSDGSYAWAGRKTYLKELEALDIPAIDLLIGTSLRVSNVSANHYWSSIGRTGRALTDASDKDALEERLVTMISDDKLDPFNRLLMAYLFSNYIHHLDDETRKNTSQEKLRNAVQTMPSYAREAWDKG